MRKIVDTSLDYLILEEFFWEMFEFWPLTHLSTVWVNVEISSKTLEETMWYSSSFLFQKYLRKRLHLVSIAYLIAEKQSRYKRFFLLGWRLKVPQLFSTFIDSLRLKLWFFIVL